MKAIHTPVGVTSIATPCSARKQKLPAPTLKASKLPRGNQAMVAKAWLDRLESAVGLEGTIARDLYAGRSFRRARDAADVVGCQFFVVSAGLGFIDGEAVVPSYDLTLSADSSEALGRRVTHLPRSSQWWSSLKSSPFSSPLTSLCVGRSRILMALTGPYAEMIGPSLTELLPMHRRRFRILGFGLKRYLPLELHEQIIVYDDRLNQLIPGTRLDGASRALAHFAQLVATHPITSSAADQALVDGALSVLEPASPTSRRRVTDIALEKHIKRFIGFGLTPTAALKRLRFEANVACEERRFRMLYEKART